MLQTLLSGLLAFGLCAATILLGRLVRSLAALAAEGRGGMGQYHGGDAGVPRFPGGAGGTAVPPAAPDAGGAALRGPVLPGRRRAPPRRRVGCLSFTVEEASPFDLAMLLDQLGFAVRSGRHCAQPLLRSLGTEYALRVSSACYNTPEEIDGLLAALERVIPLCAQ